MSQYSATTHTANPRDFTCVLPDIDGCSQRHLALSGTLTQYRRGEYGRSRPHHEGPNTAVRSSTVNASVFTITTVGVDVRTVVYGKFITMLNSNSSISRTLPRLSQNPVRPKIQRKFGSLSFMQVERSKNHRIRGSRDASLREHYDGNVDRRI